MATLCTLRLLRQLPQDSNPGVACITFACPAIGNSALVDCVQTTGWEPFFRNMLVPGVHCAATEYDCIDIFKI